MHHSRRKSGHGLGNSSMTDVRKAADSSSSRHKSSSSAKQTSSSTSRRSGGSQNGSRSTKTSSHDREDDYYWDEERRESFPQFCMTCEKQFVAKDDRFLYCSEACRDYDQEYGSTISTRHYKDNNQKSLSTYYTDRQEPRDIIPRASPSRPSSTYFSPTMTPARTSSTLPTNASTSSAIAALRSLSIRDASPPSPTSTSGIWPFASRSPAVTPTASYTRSSAFSANYESGYYRTTGFNYYGNGTSNSAAPGSERPLPPRRPGSYARPKSIELVTPLIGQ